MARGAAAVLDGTVEAVAMLAVGTTAKAINIIIISSRGLSSPTCKPHARQQQPQ